MNTNKNQIEVSTWRNSKKHNNSVYGVRVLLKDRDVYFKVNEKYYLIVDGKKSLMNITNGFFDNCPEIRDLPKNTTIKDFLLRNRLDSWEKGKPNKLKLEIIDNNTFELKV